MILPKKLIFELIEPYIVVDVEKNNIDNIKVYSCPPGWSSNNELRWRCSLCKNSRVQYYEWIDNWVNHWIRMHPFEFSVLKTRYGVKPDD